MSEFPPDSTTPELPAASPVRRGSIGARIAWAMILLAAGAAVFMQNRAPVAGEGPIDDRLGLLLMKMQSQYMVGIARLMNDPAQVYAQASVLDVGSVGQRQRFVTLAAELVGPDEARTRLETLDLEIRATLSEPEYGFELTPADERTQELLRTLYYVDRDETTMPRELSAGDRATLVENLGWFGQLALASPDAADPQAREEVLASANRVALALMIGVGLLVAAGLAGVAGLIVMVVLTLSGKVRSGLGPSRAPDGIYAETFAVWLVLFFLLQFAAGLVALRVGMGLAVSGAAFVLSLSALIWPRLRGVPWGDTRRDVGLTLGRDPSLEPVFGVAGYLMALPPLALGAGISLVLILIQGMFAEPGAPFTPAGGPAHPIVLELAGSSLATKLQVLLLASVIAPLVEETMFRGVLYRHLRGVSSRSGIVLSILFSGTLSGLIFAAIHPQGWVAIPALMSLAWMFSLVREWRGTLIPSMVMHGLSNGVVMLLLLNLLGS